MPSNSLAATPPGSPVPAASESPLWDKPDPLPLVALVGGKPQAHERLGDAALLALLPHKQQHPRPPRLVVGEKRASLFLRVTNSRSHRLGSCQSTPSR